MEFRWLAMQVALASSPAWAAEPTAVTTPYPGVEYARYDLASPSARVHVVAVDLTSSDLELLATAEDARGRTVSAHAAATGTHIVVNGDFFDPDGYRPAGLARGDRATWTMTADDQRSAVATFFRGPTRTELALSPPEVVLTSLDDKVSGAVSGRPMLVRDGAAMTAPDCTDVVALPCLPAPRTALARSADGETMWLVVVDGWQAGSPGMTALELAAFVDELGADEAVMLDGGSASALFIEASGGLVSSPSDGVERPVANHLAIRVSAPQPGFLRGVVRERNLEGPALAATVELDDGRTLEFDGTGEWQFTIAPRWACATARATGYHPNTSCRQIEAQETIYGSIFLFPNSDFVDAGPDDADAGVEADAGPGAPDGGAAADAGEAGIDEPGPVGCGCQGAGGPAGGAGLGWLVGLALVGAVGARRRGGPR